MLNFPKTFATFLEKLTTGKLEFKYFTVRTVNSISSTLTISNLVHNFHNFSFSLQALKENRALQGRKEIQVHDVLLG